MIYMFRYRINWSFLNIFIPYPLFSISFWGSHLELHKRWEEHDWRVSFYFSFKFITHIGSLINNLFHNCFSNCNIFACFCSSLLFFPLLVFTSLFIFSTLNHQLDLIESLVFLYHLLVMRTTLFMISRFYKLRHHFVSLVNSSGVNILKKMGVLTDECKIFHILLLIPFYVGLFFWLTMWLLLEFFLSQIWILALTVTSALFKSLFFWFFDKRIFSIDITLPFLFSDPSILYPTLFYALTLHRSASTPA